MEKVRVERVAMPNGEHRSRVFLRDLTYICTRGGSSGAWQSSQFHRETRELYVVLEGWMALAVGGNVDGCSIRVLHPGDYVATIPLEPHNVYLPAKAKILTVKSSSSALAPGTGSVDWYPDARIDCFTKCLEEAEVPRRGAGPHREVAAGDLLPAIKRSVTEWLMTERVRGFA